MDERLRDLERRWRASGAIDDEAAWLGERLRTGDLAPERARLAAWLGHPAAEALTGVRFGDEPLQSAGEVRRAEAALWEGVAVAGPDAARRALLAHARRLHRAALAPLRHDGRPPGERRRVEAAAGWLRAAAQVIEQAQALVLGPRPGADPRAQLGRAAAALRSARRPVAPAALAGEPAQAYRDLLEAVVVLDAAFERAPGPLPPTRTPGRFRALRQVLRNEVAPWALGRGDPLRDEAERRLDRVAVASPCSAAWERMRPIDAAGRVRACDTCQLNVHDLSALGRAEAEALLLAHEGARLCVRLYRRADGRVLTRDCPVGLDARLEPAREIELLGVVA